MVAGHLVVRPSFLGACLSVVLIGCASGGPAEPTEAVQPALSAGQREILADGVVTPEEYDSAFYSMRDCMEENGVVTKNVSRQPSGQLMLRYEAGDDEQDPAHQIYDQCESEHYLAVVDAWIDQGLTGDPKQDNILYCVLGDEFEFMTEAEVMEAMEEVDANDLRACES